MDTFVNPIEAFVAERLEITPAGEKMENIGTAQIWREFAAYCHASPDAETIPGFRIGEPGAMSLGRFGLTRQIFARQLRDILGLPPVKVVSVSGVKMRGWSGVRWKR